MKDVKHIFFDLDHTLWDFEKNSSEAIFELFHQENLNTKIESFENFIADYQRINHEYWDKFNAGEIDKETVRYGRFYELFQKHKIENHIEVGKKFADLYLELAPTKTHLFNNTHEVLQYLSAKYQVHIITNGFKEVLQLKIKLTDIEKYFDLILTAEDVGVNKPHPLVFETAMKKVDANPNESVMIGDSYKADIVGAQNVGMKTIHFNPKKEPKKTESIEIHCLSELKSLL